MSASGWDRHRKLLGLGFEKWTGFHQLKICKGRTFHAEKIVIAKCGSGDSMTCTGHDK